MIQAANLLMHTAHLSGYDQIGELVDMITVHSARAMNVLEGYGIKPGRPADLIVLDAESEFDALRLMSECLYVIRKGQVVCETLPAHRTLRWGGEERRIDFKLPEK